VDVNGEDNSKREFPSPDAPVNAEAQEHGEEGAGLGEAEEEEFRLGEDEDDNELEFPEEKSDDAERATGFGSFWFRMGRGLWCSVELPNQLIDLLPDGGVLSGVRREEFDGAPPTG
jgi:hypothetical protein